LGPTCLSFDKSLIVWPRLNSRIGLSYQSSFHPW
jgi:hypothetical protein